MRIALRHRHLAACLALAAAGGALASSRPDPTDAPRKPAPSGTIVVTNCDDAGTGSLRDAVATAVSGETIDLTMLGCSTITLTSGAIAVSQDDLTLLGPGASQLAIDGGGLSSLMRHSGSGTLSFAGLTLTHGYYAVYYGHGGCVFSAGNVGIYSSIVSNCVVTGGFARGGGIFAVHDLSIVNSIITGNLADGLDLDSSGGGFVVGGYLHTVYSTISDNIARTAPPPDGTFSVGGGADTFGNVSIISSTISGNQAKNVAGIVFEAHGTPTAAMINSTVSGNMPTDNGPFGGIYAGIPLSVYNSTIAFNGGIGLVSGYAVTLQSTIIADNTTDLRILSGGSVGGANNLINIATVVPPDTIRDCALLQPLAHNGGPTETHALIGTSPAIDAGSNVMTLSSDQRGLGFARVVGASADIGAFEWQGGVDDAIFANAFEKRCES